MTGNAPETEVRPLKVDPQSGAAKFLRAAGKSVPAAMEEHVFAPTRPLPTYLVAIHTGPFVRVDGTVAPDPERSTPLPLGAVATQPQKDKMGYVMTETPRIVQLLERYFGEPFPFPKLDQIGSPIMPGAMENAGADTYGDGIIYLPPNASTGSKQEFGMVVAHELAHQWFGDLVTPAWWDDIWLNESFANWMGYRIGNEWRPELNIGVGGLAEGFSAMNTDALEVGRPIHQAIATNGEIDSAFDSITYGKGGHVIAMIAAYLGDDKFREGVRLHLKRHAYGNATSEQFFQSLADSAQDPRVLAALKSFVDQPGVPVLDLARNGSQFTATQSRYAFLGSTARAEHWTIPFCYRPIDGERACTLIDRPSITFAAPAGGAFVPNAGGTGYYRFNLAPADWQALIARSAALKPAEALAVQDSLWAAFRAGKVPAAFLVTAAKAMAANPDSNAAINGGARLSGLRSRGLIADAQSAAYRRLIGSLYAPMLAKMGFDPAAGAHAADTPDRQKLRQSLVSLVADDAEDKAVDDRLAGAATRYLGGDQQALDPAFLGAGFAAYARRGGLPAARKLVEVALASEDSDVRASALVAAGSTGRRDVQDYLLALSDPRLRGYDRLVVIQSLTGTPGTVESAGDWLLAHYDALRSGGNGVFITSRLPGALGSQCGVDRAAKIETVLGPKVRAAESGVLEFERVVESIRHCGALRDAKAGEIAAAIDAS
ncbi:M1 family aminopeptidase [Sphingomonas sp. UYP23]